MSELYICSFFSNSMNPSNASIKFTFTGIHHIYIRYIHTVRYVTLMPSVLAPSHILLHCRSYSLIFIGTILLFDLKQT